MKVVIVEDEIAASENLEFILKEINDSIEIVKVLETVKASVDYFKKNDSVDLIFMDIHLADGLSFEIFESVDLKTPVIFTTAYDQYAIKAFKVNSIDYLLKPLNKEDLKNSIDKFKSQNKTADKSIDSIQLESVLSLLNQKKNTFKTNYLLHVRDELIPIKVDDIAYFFIENGIVKLKTKENQTLQIDKKLDDIENEVDPIHFYRVNRQMIVNKEAIEKIKFYFNSKLILQVLPTFNERIVVSKAKSSGLKKWMDS